MITKITIAGTNYEAVKMAGDNFSAVSGKYPTFNADGLSVSVYYTTKAEALEILRKWLNPIYFKRIKKHGISGWIEQQVGFMQITLERYNFKIVSLQ